MISASISARRTSGRLSARAASNSDIAGLDRGGIDHGMRVFRDFRRCGRRRRGCPCARRRLTLALSATSRALNLVAQIVHDLGDAAHADAADADEMDGADVQRHAGGRRACHHAASPPICSTRSARRCAASGVASGMRRGGAARQIRRVARKSRSASAASESAASDRAARTRQPAPALRQDIGIGRLVVVQRDGQRHQDGGAADRHQFGHRAGAGAARSPDAPRAMRARQVGEEARKLGADLGIAHRCVAHRLDVFGAALLHD